MLRLVSKQWVGCFRLTLHACPEFVLFGFPNRTPPSKQVASVRAFLVQRVTFAICSSPEPKALGLALSRVPMMNEAGRRKLFRYEAMGNVPTDWQKLKALKRGRSFRG